MNLEQFTAIFPTLSDDHAKEILPPLLAAMDEFEISDPLREAAFVAQTGHESALFTRFSENLNYSADGLIRIFGKYFTRQQAVDYERQPQRIANRVYADRMGNGGEETGDGWRYRGHGPIQITGKDNHRAAGIAIGVDLENEPERAADLDVGFRVAGWFWASRNLNPLADQKEFALITKKINGALTGITERTIIYNRALKVLEAE